MAPTHKLFLLLSGAAPSSSQVHKKMALAFPPFLPLALDLVSVPVAG
jgi:hypothetical protein